MDHDIASEGGQLPGSCATDSAHRSRDQGAPAFQHISSEISLFALKRLVFLNVVRQLNLRLAQRSGGVEEAKKDEAKK
jgi:hypothetical protein